MVEDLIRFWKSRKVNLYSGASETEIESFEMRHNVILPAPLRELLKVSNGLECDHDLIHFWSLTEIRPILDSSLLHSYFIFADFLINSHFYAVKLTASSDTPSVVGAYRPKRAWCPLAPSFDGFISLYLENYDAIVTPQGFRG